MPDSHEYNHTPTQTMVAGMNAVREMHAQFDKTLREVARPSRELSLALTKLEEAAMWANKAISHAKQAEEQG